MRAWCLPPLIALACSAPRFEVSELDASAAGGLAGAGGAAGDAAASTGGASDAGPDATSGGSSGSGTGGLAGAGAGGVGGQSCAGGQLCAPKTTAGWENKLMVYAGSAATTCPAGTSEVFRGGTSVDAPPAVCKCECSGTVSCPTSASFKIHTTSGCGTACETIVGSGGTCMPINTSCVGPSHQFSVPAQTFVSSCAPQPSETKSPASFQNQTLVCMAPASGTCNGGECIEKPPSGFAPKACIGRSGTHDCPGGGYSVRTVSYASFVDNRGCSACFCNPGKCGFAQVWPNGSCSGTIKRTHQLENGESVCDTSTWAPVAVSYVASAAYCVPNKPSPSGGATFNFGTAYTTCCQP